MTDDYKYDALLSGFQRQEATMKEVAASMRRNHANPMKSLDAGECVESWLLDAWADELDPPEPVAEADKTEQFSKDCEKKPKRKGKA